MKVPFKIMVTTKDAQEIIDRVNQDMEEYFGFKENLRYEAEVFTGVIGNEDPKHKVTDIEKLTGAYAIYKTLDEMYPDLSFRVVMDGEEISKDQAKKAVDKATQAISQAETFKTLIKLREEKQLRCGDGAGNISHSTNCNCKELDKQIAQLEKEMENDLRDN